MAIHTLFSKRQKQLRNEPADVLTYHHLPTSLRTQILYIMADAIGNGSPSHSAEEYYEYIRNILLREYGITELHELRYPVHTSEKDINNCIADSENVEKVLDTVELCFRVIDTLLRKDIQHGHRRKLNPDDAISELNYRFKEQAIGYAYESGELIKVDSTYIHAEVVKPLLHLISNPRFAGIDEEYRNAHEHYRHSRNKECLNECLKALESTMKVICDVKGWNYDKGASSKQLIQICFDNSLIPVHLQTQFGALRTILESGVPTLRNKQGGHGQGGTPLVVDDTTARYALNLCGANVIYLIELSGL